MNTRKTAEMETSKEAKNEVNGLSKKPSAEVRKPTCKDKVCSVNWKPVRPNA